MSAAVPFFFALYSAAQKERDGCTLPPCLQLDAFMFILRSFLPLLSALLFLPSASVGVRL